MRSHVFQIEYTAKACNNSGVWKMMLHNYGGQHSGPTEILLLEFLQHTRHAVEQLSLCGLQVWEPGYKSGNLIGLYVQWLKLVRHSLPCFNSPFFVSGFSALFYFLFFFSPSTFLEPKIMLFD
ncbi:hypothetical protein NE237_000852 [Protea cynaroides]|uniref:Uncharacterized protein n=1 Tax=Protea cynaroides TaxID=273540 RepID=A0A9Q0KS94_9MAGN|nr:hypothetical protein NE237_000852 [Protea cynaroides]